MKLILTIYLLAWTVAAQAQTPSILLNFNKDEGHPYSLVQGADGNFYVSTSKGLILKITPAGSLFQLYNFAESFVNGVVPDSAPFPAYSMLQASDGNFYGLTGGCESDGCLFEMTPAGVVTILYNFSVTNFSLLNPLIQGADGNFYGTAEYGGSTTTQLSFGDGTVFKITPTGTLTTLYNFTGPDGSNPGTGLVQGSDGNFYGTTQYGGANNCQSDGTPGCGTIFKITPTGVLTTLHSFSVTDGANPDANLVQGVDGNFYGTTPEGGSGNCQSAYNNGCGTVFKITPQGTFTLLHNFDIVDGTQPEGALIQAAGGNFYGHTVFGGAGACTHSSSTSSPGCGTIFQMTPQGALTTLYSFPVPAGGAPDPVGLILGSDGNLYGTTADDGTFGAGTLFEFSIPAANTPEIASSSGVLNGASFQPGISPGSWITINGTNLSSKTDTWNSAIVNGALPITLDGVSVMVGDQAAYIEYVSPKQINAVVPNVAAGTVPVTVTNSNGTSQAATAQLQAKQPAFFQWGTYAVATRQDFSLAVKNGTFPGTTTVPAAPGDVIILWGTGFGPTSPSAPAGEETPSTNTYNTANTVSVTVGSKPATVYGAALAPGYAGLYQVAIQIPASLANGDYPVVATINGAQSPSTTMITVQQ
jgi:uncharacterized protein (TIGR03437 family)